MIEYALLFGLGFLTAILAALLVAPAIHARIVAFTENRMRATMPLSPQEVRAQKDLVRAEMAVELARTAQHLTAERHRAGELSIRSEALHADAVRLLARNHELEAEIVEVSEAMRALQSDLRTADARVEDLKLTLAETGRDNREKQGRIEALEGRIRQLIGEIDNLRIDVAARETETEGVKARLNALRDERDQLRDEARRQTSRAKDAEMKLGREESRANRLDEKLTRERAEIADLETLLERRVSEINRLKERLRQANQEARDAARLMKTAGLQAPKPARSRKEEAELEAPLPMPERRLREAEPAAPAEIERPVAPPRVPALDDDAARDLSDEVRARAAALADRLMSAPPESQDDNLRNEVADIAARMVALTAHSEGLSSPIRPIIKGRASTASRPRTSLAERAMSILEPGDKAAE